MIDQYIIRHYLMHLVIFLGIINFILWVSFIQITTNLTQTSYNMVHKTIMEYGEFDLEHLCKLTDCSKIKTTVFADDTNTYSPNEIGILVPTQELIKPYLKINGFVFDKDFNSILIFDDMQLKINLKNKDTFYILFKTYIYVNLGFFFIFSFMYFRNTLKERERNLLSLIAKESNIHEKYINLLNENINHELNTPILILKSKLKKLEMELTLSIGNMLNDTCSSRYCHFLESVDMRSFPDMFSAIDVLINIVENTNSWKQIKYSNGNKSIHDIITVQINGLGLISRSNIKYKLADTLKDVTLDGEYINADLQRCITNLIKNSIEAKATYIYFEGGLHNNKLILFIGDNGHGIKDKFGKIIPEEKYDKIFDPYYSLKETDICDRNTFLSNIICSLKEFLYKTFKFKYETNKIKEIRGIGTYVMRTDLRNKGGDLNIQETSEKGTVFRLETRAKQKIKKETIQ